MKSNFKIMRYLFIPAMIPVMSYLFKLVKSADTLHTWQYEPGFPPPTQADYSHAAFVYYTALLTPLLIGLAAAIIAFCKRSRPCWPIPDTLIVASIYLLYLIMGLLELSVIKYGAIIHIGVFGAYYLMGGIVVTALFNLGACLRQYKWAKLANSALVIFGAMFYLYVLYTIIIYVDA